MAWFIFQSVVVIVLAFLLGLLVGWLWWRRRKVHFGESEALTDLATQHGTASAAQQADLDHATAELAAKDAEVARLNGLVSDDAATVASRHEAVVAGKDAELADLAARSEADAAERADLSTRLDAKDAEIARLSAVIEGAEVTAATHRDELASRDEHLAEKDAEIARLSAAATTVAVPVVTPAPAEAGGVTADSGPTVEPTEPTTQEIAGLATPVEETAGVEAPAEPVAAEPVAAEPVVEVPEPDELERVEGIGPRIGAALRQAGITTFRALADADTATLQRALEKAGLRFAPSLPTWSRQAALLADGDEDGFVRLTESLVAGRDTSGTK